MLSVLGFASTFIVGAALTKGCGVSPEVLAFLRFVIASVAMLAWSGVTVEGRRRLLSPTRADWLKMGWLGPVGTSIMAWCVFMGCARVSAANASMADALTPLMIFVVAACKTRHIEGRALIGLILGLIGALLVVQVICVEGIVLEAYTIGDVFILLAAATWGVYTVYGREPIKRLGASVFTAWTMLIGAVAFGVFLPFMELQWPATAKAWWLVGMLGMVSTLLPFLTWNAAQRYLPMSVLGISAYFTPVFAVALAIVFLGEIATMWQWIGTFFIVVSAMVEVRERRG